MKKKTMIWICSFAVLMIAAAVLYNVLLKNYRPDPLMAGPGSSAGQGENSAQKVSAPDFTVYDQSGNKVKLSDYAGKPVVLNFWTTWCGFCKKEMPDFEAAYRILGTDVQFLMVNVTDGQQETQEKAEKYVADQQYTMPIFFDLEASAASAYRIASLPTTYFIDREGFVVTAAKDALDAQALQRGIDRIMPK